MEVNDLHQIMLIICALDMWRWGHFTFGVFLFKTHSPSVLSKTSDKFQMRSTLQTTWPALKTNKGHQRQEKSGKLSQTKRTQLAQLWQIPESNSLKEKKIYSSLWFQRFQSKVSWFHCFRPEVGQKSWWWEFVGVRRGRACTSRLWLFFIPLWLLCVLQVAFCVIFLSLLLRCSPAMGDGYTLWLHCCVSSREL
jgi:hypothetical protein